MERERERERERMRQRQRERKKERKKERKRIANGQKNTGLKGWVLLFFFF
jgi:hypothetical protein